RTHDFKFKTKMKYYTLLILLLVFFGYSYSQTTVSGYYVTKTNDTITAQIRIPKSIFGSVDFSKFLFKVEVMDSISGTKKFKPEEIKSFGFLFDGENYSLFSQPTITENNFRFLQPVIIGQKTSLYQFQTVGQNGASLGTFYTFEKADGTYTFLNTGIKNLDKFRETLKEFYKENLGVQELVDTKFQSRTSIKSDIIEIVQTANK
ncbi:MAG TPA: hypothetical protein PLS08_06590, partial [Chryseolinea sp.]|nr:hypothetical protein [Chryseolinea sp.]